MNAQQMLDRSGITYRQLNHWTTKGYLLPRDGHAQGSGYPCDWPSGECAIARSIKALADAGVRVDVAARVARQHRIVGQSVTRIVRALKVPARSARGQS